MDHRTCERLLKAIKDLALLGYPFPRGSTTPDVAALAFGEIAGIASKALAEMPPDTRPAPRRMT